MRSPIIILPLPLYISFILCAFSLLSPRIHTAIRPPVIYTYTYKPHAHKYIFIHAESIEESLYIYIKYTQLHPDMHIHRQRISTRGRPDPWNAMHTKTSEARKERMRLARPREKEEEVSLEGPRSSWHLLTPGSSALVSIHIERVSSREIPRVYILRRRQSSRWLSCLVYIILYTRVGAGGEYYACIPVAECIIIIIPDGPVPYLFWVGFF